MQLVNEVLFRVPLIAVPLLALGHELVLLLVYSLDDLSDFRPHHVLLFYCVLIHQLIEV